MLICPCCSKKFYNQCCGLFIQGIELPKTPEELMRSRYTAYTQSNMDYIEKTMREDALANFDPVDAGQWSKQVTWLGLEVINTSQNNNEGTVEFKASYEINNKKFILAEISHFKRLDNKWYYVSGSLKPNNKIIPKQKPNESCACGSGRKHKKCCGANI